MAQQEFYPRDIKSIKNLTESARWSIFKGNLEICEVEVSQWKYEMEESEPIRSTKILCRSYRINEKILPSLHVEVFSIEIRRIFRVLVSLSKYKTEWKESFVSARICYRNQFIFLKQGQQNILLR